MVRALPNAQPAAAEFEPQAHDWQALRGELVSLLDQMEGQYARGGSTDSGFAQRMRDLRYQVIDTDPDDRRREALRSVKRQIDRFNDRGESEAANSDAGLQSAIQQIRARTQGSPAAAPIAEAPRHDELTQTMTALNRRLAQLETELGAQHGNGPQVKEIASQVSQLSHVVELLAGAVGETGQIKRLEAQIGSLATLINAGQKIDLSQLTDRLDQVSATVDRLADLQVQQIQHVVQEAEAAPQKGPDALKAMQAIELSVRNIYDRIDALERNLGGPAPELEQITEMLGVIGNRLANDGGGRPDRLLGLVDALNGRINEMESKGEAFAELKGDIGDLRDAILIGIEPRFSALETQLGDIGQRLDSRSDEAQGIAQVEAQIRQLVARMDQTGEQLTNIASQQAEAEQRHATVAIPDFEALAAMTAARTADAIARNRPPGPNLNDLAERAATHAFAAMGRREAPQPDFEALAELVANRTTDALKTFSKLPTEQLEAIADMLASKTSAALARQNAPAPDFEALGELVAARTSETMKTYAQLPVERLDAIAGMVANVTASLAARDSANSPAPTLSDASLDEIEARIGRLVQGFAARAPEPAAIGEETVERRLKRVEASLARRQASSGSEPHGFETPAEVAAAIPAAIPTATPEPGSVKAAKPAEAAPTDSMPHDPNADAPLRDFGFSDPAPAAAAAAFENRSSAPRQAPRPPGASEAQPGEAAAEPRIAPAMGFNPADAVLPPRPQSSFDREIDTAFAAPATPAAAPAEPLPTSSRNTFIEAARRSAQRRNAAPLPSAPDSAIGRALSRFQPKAEKAAAPVTPEPVAIVPEPAPAEPKRKAKIALPGMRARKRKPEPAAAPGDTPEPSSMAAADDPAIMVAEVRPAQQESFLSRHRRTILVTASCVAIAVMALNLVAQRLAPEANQAPGNELAAIAAKPAVFVTPPAQTLTAAHMPGPTLAAAAAAAKGPQLSAAIPDVGTPEASGSASGSTIATSPGPLAATDPTATASIAPDEMLDKNKGPLAAAMPPALATGDTESPTASAPAAGGVTAPTALATDPLAAAPGPAAIESPVKVELPPASLGPLDLRQSAANGDARSQFEVAAIYSEGRAVPQDFKQAVVWYERAAAQGFVPAQYRLGNLYETGKGVKQDYEEARLWYQRAADAGNRMAMHNLAALYAGGQFGKQDFASAANWFQQAADLGIRDSQFNLGMLYARGLGVPQSLETAYKWFSLAAATGDSGSGKARDDIARSLDAATLKQASAEAAAWKPKSVNLAANFAPIGTWEKTFNPGPTIATKEVILKVQQALTRLGYDVGAPDGQAGPKTTVAIKAFEQGTGMTQVGAINPRLLAVLGSQPV